MTLPTPRAQRVLAAVLIALLVAAHLAAGDGYGYFRDELYYVACARHLDWGYVDQPPLSLALLAAWMRLFGNSIFSLRTLPLLAGASALWLTLAMARRLGGGLSAMLLAGLAFVAAPVYLAMHGFYSMNAFDILFWTLAAYWLLRILQAPVEDRVLKLWLVLGLTLGFGLLNKISLLWFGAALGLGLLLTTQRRRLLQPGPYLAAGLALLLFSPYLLWEWRGGFPTVEFMRNASTHKYVAQPPLQFLGGIMLAMNPVSVPLWLAGLVWSLRAEGGRYRVLGIVFLAVLAILLLNGTSKPEYLSPAFPFLLAAGACAWERVLRGRNAALRFAYPALIAAAGATIAPLALPVLPVERFLAYQQVLGFAPPASERQEQGVLPQFYADRFGWPELAAAVAEVYRKLSEAERKHALVLARNYGEAGALDFFGRELGLPPARSQHNSYYFWGYGDFDGAVAIVLSKQPDELHEQFASVEKAGEFAHAYAMPYENHLGIYICRGFKGSIPQAWAAGKHFI